MSLSVLTKGHHPAIAKRTQELLQENQHQHYVRTDRLFACLMIVQWLAAMAAAFWITPRTWIGIDSETHLHVWTACLLGGLITLFPVLLTLLRPGTTLTLKQVHRERRVVVESRAARFHRRGAVRVSSCGIEHWFWLECWKVAAVPKHPDFGFMSYSVILAVAGSRLREDRRLSQAMVSMSGFDRSADDRCSESEPGSESRVAGTC